MAATIIPTSRDIYLEVDGKKVAVVQSYTAQTTKTSTTLATNRINFVDEDDTWSILFRLCEKITHTRCTNTYEHFYKVRTGNRKEWYPCFTSYGFSKQCFTCTWRSSEQYTFRNFSTDSCKFTWIFQEFYYFF